MDGKVMGEDEQLELLRQKRMAELQMQAQQEAAQKEKVAEVDQARQGILRTLMTPEARERLGRLKMAFPEETDTIENQIIQLAQAGRLPGPISDDEMRRLLEQIMPRRKDINIRRV